MGGGDVPSALMKPVLPSDRQDGGDNRLEEEISLYSRHICCHMLVTPSIRNHKLLKPCRRSVWATNSLSEFTLTEVLENKRQYSSCCPVILHLWRVHQFLSDLILLSHSGYYMYQLPLTLIASFTINSAYVSKQHFMTAMACLLWHKNWIFKRPLQSKWEHFVGNSCLFVCCKWLCAISPRNLLADCTTKDKCWPHSVCVYGLLQWHDIAGIENPINPKKRRRKR
jgi:hypothetical protein